MNQKTKSLNVLTCYFVETFAMLSVHSVRQRIWQSIVRYVVLADLR